MADFIWGLTAAQLPEAVFDWQRIIYGLQLPQQDASRAGVTTPHLAVWNFQGEQPLAGGMAALFAEYFRWLGPSFDLLFTRFEQNDNGLLPWTSEMMQIEPATFMPEHTADYAKVWGSLAAEALDVHYAFGEDSHTWTLTGSTAQIVEQLIGLVPEVLTGLSINTTNWTSDEPLDIDDAGALAGLLRSWGELAIRYELTKAGYEEYVDALDGAIRRIVSAAMTGSRFACWAACRALWPVAADDNAPHQVEAEDALVSLGSVFPRVAWPNIALSLLEWGRGDFTRATDLLESAVKSDPRALQGWQLLALLYEELGQADRAIGVCREAISGNIADATIFYNLGRLLLDQAEQSDDETGNQAIVVDALEAFKEAEQRGLRTPELALRMMDAYEALSDEAGMWSAFAQVVQTDVDGSIMWQIIEDADTYDDFEPGLYVLRQAADSAPDGYEALAAYVRALIVLNRHAEALEPEALPRLRTLATDDYARAETAQLALEASAPDFETAYGEVADDIEAGIMPDSDGIGLLKEALSREPDFADGAVLLAQSYSMFDNHDAAMQTLTAARERLPDHLELVLSMADTLWGNDDDEQALALMYDALAKHPDDVALLARLGEYHFEVGEDDTARSYLARAEALEPRHPELLRVREQVAREMDEFESVDDDEEIDIDEAEDNLDTDMDADLQNP